MTAPSRPSLAVPADELTGTPVGHRRTALTVTGETLPDLAGRLTDQGYRLALVAAHDDGDALRAVYLYTAAGPDRRGELHPPVDPAGPALPSPAAPPLPAGRAARGVR